MEKVWRFGNQEVRLVIRCVQYVDKRLEIFQPGSAPHNLARFIDGKSLEICNPEVNLVIQCVLYMGN